MRSRHWHQVILIVGLVMGVKPHSSYVCREDSADPKVEVSPAGNQDRPEVYTSSRD